MRIDGLQTRSRYAERNSLHLFLVQTRTTLHYRTKPPLPVTCLIVGSQGIKLLISHPEGGVHLIAVHDLLLSIDSSLRVFFEGGVIA